MVTDTQDPTFVTTDHTQAFPLVQVADLAQVRAFYLETMGCPATYDLERYLQVQLTPFGEKGPQLCFMVFEGATGSQGVLLSVPVANADQVQAKLEDAGVPIADPATDRPWGWRSLHVVDPTGLVLDFFHELPQ
ncbi:MAG: VOC family protein [Myxococcota bacterium]